MADGAFRLHLWLSGPPPVSFCVSAVYPRCDADSSPTRRIISIGGRGAVASGGSEPSLNTNFHIAVTISTRLVNSEWVHYWCHLKLFRHSGEFNSRARRI